LNIAKALGRLGGILIGREAGAKSLASVVAQTHARRRPRTARSRATRLDMAFGKKCRTAAEGKRRKAICAENLRNLDLW
jgi:hypothetical protein